MSSDGSTYEGDWQEGVKEGNGVEISKDGDKYQG